MTDLEWSDFREERERRGRPFVIAHRGVPGQAPENTLHSFRLALEQGAFALETDLRFTSDNQMVCVHDATLERTTNGNGKVGDHSLEELRRLKTREPGTGEPGDHSIPTLTELIEFTDARTPLLLELKDPLFRNQQHAQMLIDTLARFDIIQRCAIVSFQQTHVDTVEALCPLLPTGNITLKNPIPQRGIELLGPIWPLLYANPFYVAHAHRLGSVVCPLDETPEKRMRYYLRLGVDAVLTYDPAAALRAMERD